MVDYPIRIELRLTQQMADLLEDWRRRQPAIPTRQEAIRELLTVALQQKRDRAPKRDQKEDLMTADQGWAAVGAIAQASMLKLESDEAARALRLLAKAYAVQAGTTAGTLLALALKLERKAQKNSTPAP